MRILAEWMLCLERNGYKTNVDTNFHIDEEARRELENCRKRITYRYKKAEKLGGIEHLPKSEIEILEIDEQKYKKISGHSYSERKRKKRSYKL